jgi:hypothetical protein
VRSTTKKPCCARTLPWPAQVGQVSALVPGSAPVPLHGSHGVETSISMVEF